LVFRPIPASNARSGQRGQPSASPWPRTKSAAPDVINRHEKRCSQQATGPRGERCASLASAPRRAQEGRRRILHLPVPAGTCYRPPRGAEVCRCSRAGEIRVPPARPSSIGLLCPRTVRDEHRALGGLTPRPRRALVVELLGGPGGRHRRPALPSIPEVFADEPGVETLARLVLTVPALAMALFSPFAGLMADRAGRVPLLVLSLILYAAAGTSGRHPPRPCTRGWRRASGRAEPPGLLASRVSRLLGDSPAELLGRRLQGSPTLRAPLQKVQQPGQRTSALAQKSPTTPLRFEAARELIRLYRS
jgi:hypothetical protein